MRISVFTSNQPRHLSLIEQLAGIADEVFAVIECNTVFPGKVNDFYDNSAVMQAYFSRVIDAERQVFGHSRFLPKNVSVLPVKMGDLNYFPSAHLQAALESDRYIVFGSSYIKGELINHLIKHQAINIHMGVSPYYRGSGCNFWSAYDHNFEYVGATIHLLSSGLDSGDILFHALPPIVDDPFVLGMMAVKSAHQGLISYLESHQNQPLKAVRQDKAKEIRYSRYKDFTDQVALEYLDNLPTAEQISSHLKNRDLSQFLNPFII